MYFVYIIECNDGTLYTGITTDVVRRFSEHKKGKGARYTRAHGVRAVVHIEKRRNRSSASRREAEIKSMKKNEKIKLIKL